MAGSTTRAPGAPTPGPVATIPEAMTITRAGDTEVRTTTEGPLSAVARPGRPSAPAVAVPGGPPRAEWDHLPMPVQRRRLLLVEDEPAITTPLVEALASEGFEAHVAASASESLELAERIKPDLVLLDLMLPDGSGFDVCRQLRAGSDVPIIMLTARGEEADRVVGLEMGADDYIVKPFSAREVVARIRAVLRR